MDYSFKNEEKTDFVLLVSLFFDFLWFEFF